MPRSERGASGLLILVILVLIAVSVLATSLLSRIGSASDEQNNTYASLNRAAAALDAFAGATMRLPCPANPSDPAGDVGVEVTSGAAGCQYPEGTVPWKTIGMSRNDAYDAWGHKISYRVYLGNAGSLVQAGGASLADCDTIEAFPTGPTATAGGVGGLCQPGTTGPGTANPDPSLRTTPPAQFLAGKGLTLTDFGVVHNDVAYVLLSHGMTGLGSYTSSGAQLDIPKGDEKSNLNDTGPFFIEAFSDSDTSATDPSHFDDLLVYRTISDLATRANLAARDWPDTILSAVTFDKSTLTTALGSNPSSDTGRSTIAFNNATVSAFNSGGAQDISFVSGGGPTNPDAIGGVSGGDGLLGSAGGEGVRVDFNENARQFAFTVNQFDDNAALHERLELRFFDVAGSTSTLVSTMIEPSCSANGKFTSFSVDACTAFDRVEIRPISMTDGSSPSSFTLAEIRTCVDSVTCQTALQSSGKGNVCSTKTFVPCSIGTNDTSVLTITLNNPNSSDMTAAAFTDTYPTGIVNAAAPGGTNTCGGLATASGGGTTLTLAGGTVPANGSCLITVNVTASLVSVYNNMTSDVTTASAGTVAGVSGTLNVLTHPAVSVSFNPTTVSTSAPSLLTLTLTNANATAIAGVAVTDTYPVGLSNSAIAGASTTCGGVVVADNSNPSPHVSLSGGTIPAGGSCAVTVSVTSTSIGSYANAIAVGAVTSGNAGANLVGASASLAVN